MPLHKHNKQQQQRLLLLLLIANAALLATCKRIPVYDDAAINNQIRLEDLEREHEQQEQQQRPVVELQDENSTLPPPRLPIRYTWRSTKPAVPIPTGKPTPATTTKDVYESAASASNDNPYSSYASGDIVYVQPAELERLRQLRAQHQQLSEGYSLPSSALLLGQPIQPPIASVAQQRIVKPIVSHADVLSEPSISIASGIHYLNNNELYETPPPPSTLLPPSSPQARAHFPSLPYPALHRPALEYGTPYVSALRRPTAIQSNQYAFAPIRQHSDAQRLQATLQSRIPLPYPPSFISITTRRPASVSRDYYRQAAAQPFRPSQPDPTPTDLWANRESKSLLDSYIPSWEVLRLMQQQHQQQQQQQSRYLATGHGGSGFGYHTLAFANGSPYNVRLYKRGLMKEPIDNEASNRKIVKKSLEKQIAEASEEIPLASA